MRRILVIDGHPDAGSYCAALALAYGDGATAGGHEVRRLAVREMRFDPILHGGFTAPQPLEPDLVEARDAVRWCEHLVIVTPCWWWHVPALLKGFIDRLFLPGVGVDYLNGPPYIRKLLKGRSARVIYTQNSPQLVAFLGREDLFWRNMRRAFLRHCGFRPVRRTLLANMRSATQEQRERWLREVRCLGLEGA
ncbi:NAD(P)H-dependent oxidoreductase [Streptomyces sp. CL7]|uniref:NAD(P)H-dependent oxidoreductase n=1 Tax=Streptomyces sp. CL7 TaxID=3096006 RepID=UPI002A75602A|nr:NAD(P)H-dependent oxidoreductase [Streptomyces sp. CL7]WPP34285.1 NAD(P)H-dependent oxidoreductase [Streptomyces sp. CL7]